MHKSKLFNLLGRIQALFKIIVINFEVIIPALVSIISAIVTIVITILGEDGKVFIVITVASSAITVLSFLINLIKSIIRQKQIIVHKYSSQELDLFYDDIVRESGFSLLKKDLSRLLYSPNDNLFVKDNIMDIPYSFKGNIHYSIPKDLSRNAYRIFIDHLKKNKYFFDSHKIRMNMGVDELSLLAEDERKMQLSVTTYFNSICSNEVSKLELRYDDDVSYCFDGYSLVKSKGDKNKESRIYKLSESQCSNHIGVSTLAHTTDGFVILTRQGDKNLIGTNKLIVSASGSVDLSDRKGCKSFGDIIVKAMNRELSEECNIKQAMIDSTKVIGYGRLLDRGGKPEFFGMTDVNISSDEFIKLANEGKEKKKGYVREFIKVKDTKLKEFIKSIEDVDNITIQLMYYSTELL